MREPEDAIRRYRAGTLSRDRLFRIIASYEGWQIARLPDGTLYTTEQRGGIWTEHRGRYLEVLTEPDHPYYDPLGVQWECLGGRDLIREHLPQYDGLRLTNGGWVNQLLSSRESGEPLRRWAEILDREEALREGTEPAVRQLLEAEWYQITSGDAPWLENGHGIRYVYLFSAPDRPGEFIANELGRLLEDSDSCVLPRVRRVNGKTLFAELAEREDFDGIAINAGSESPPRPWGPHAAGELLAGEEPRLERRLLRARSRAEMRLVMDLLGASYDQTNSFEITVAGQPVIEYSSWSPDESFSLRFHAVDSESDEGKSELLCAGLLASWVKSRIEVLSRAPEDRPGNVAEWGREGLRWLEELDRLVDPSLGRIPRSAVRLPRGSASVRRDPELLSGDWLRRSRGRLQQLLLELG